MLLLGLQQLTRKDPQQLLSIPTELSLLLVLGCIVIKLTLLQQLADISTTTENLQIRTINYPILLYCSQHQHTKL